MDSWCLSQISPKISYQKAYIMDRNIEELSKQFIQAYYSAMMAEKNNRVSLLNFYNERSTMTYSGCLYKGLTQIKNKIESFSFQRIQYQISSQDVQEGPIPGSMLVFVSGILCMDEENTFKFSQVFNICPNDQGGFYCHNDILNLVM